MSEILINTSGNSKDANAFDLPLGFFMGERTDVAEEESIAERWRDIVRGIRDEYLDSAHRFPWVIGFSGGKDSTVVTHGVFEALLGTSKNPRISWGLSE